jgi:hypothetical protein
VLDGLLGHRLVLLSEMLILWLGDREKAPLVRGKEVVLRPSVGAVQVGLQLKRLSGGTELPCGWRHVEAWTGEY